MWRRSGLVLLLAASVMAPVYARHARPVTQQIFLQPWTSHAAQRQEIKAYFSTMDRQYSHLILQWSRLGEAEFWPEDGSGWLKEVLPRHGRLKIIYGLNHGNDYFAALKFNDQDLADYLAKDRALSLSEAKKIVRQSPVAPAGWYLPEEIDDLNWNTPARQQILLQHLQELSAGLQKIKAVPVYISAFFGGHTPPVQFAALLKAMQQGSGVVWLVQDGKGVRRNPAPDTAQYLSAIHAALPAHGWKGITEKFSERTIGGQVVFCPATLDEVIARQQIWRDVVGQEAEVAFSLNQTEKSIFNAAQNCSPWSEAPVNRHQIR